MYEQGGDYASAARCFETAGDFAKAAAAKERAGDVAGALALYLKANAHEAMAECLNRAQRFFEAAQVYQKLSNVRAEVEMLRMVPVDDPNRLPAVKRLSDLLERHGHMASKNIIAFSLKNRAFTFFWVAILVIAGVFAFKQMPIEAFPDVTNTQIIIVTQWNGRSAEEVERFVTTPIEIAMNSVQHKTSVRSSTMFGLSVVKIIFEDGVEDFFARQQVNNQLRNVELPEGAEPDVQPPYGPTGEIFRYVLKSDKRDTRDLLTLQTWVIDRQLRAINII